MMSICRVSDLVEAGIVETVFMALPSASARGAHVSIDYVDALLSDRACGWLDRVSHLLIAVLRRFRRIGDDAVLRCGHCQHHPDRL